MKALVILAQSILLVTMLGSPALALMTPERLVFDVSWKGVKAGSAVQTVTAQGNEITIVNTIRSSGLVSAFFSIDDRTESVISRGERGEGLPILYRENIKEGKRRKRKEARFNFSSLTVDSTDFLKKTKKKDTISARTYDSLSSIYFIRSSDLVPGQSIFFHIYDFKRLWDTEVRVVKREEIRTPLGKFKTLVVTSQLTFNGVPAKVGNATFWFTDDSRRIPVRIRTKIKVGEITLNLVAGSYWPESDRQISLISMMSAYFVENWAVFRCRKNAIMVDALKEILPWQKTGYGSPSRAGTSRPPIASIASSGSGTWGEKS